MSDWEVVVPCKFKPPRADPTFIKIKKDIFLGHHHHRRRDHERDL